jgi:hypothetical protein
MNFVTHNVLTFILYRVCCCPKPIYVLTEECFIGNKEKFQTNSSVYSINTGNKHHLNRPFANLSCFQKGAFYSGISIFNNLPRSNTSLNTLRTGHLNCLNPRSRALNTVIQLLYFASLKIYNKFADD